jgi:hypothetical protein
MGAQAGGGTRTLEKVCTRTGRHERNADSTVSRTSVEAQDQRARQPPGCTLFLLVLLSPRRAVSLAFPIATTLVFAGSLG